MLFHLMDHVEIEMHLRNIIHDIMCIYLPRD